MNNNIFHTTDKIYGIITLSRNAMIIANHPIMERLKDIAQLGTLVFIYPNARYSRWEHSVGTAYLGRLTAEHLQKEHRKKKHSQIVKNDQEISDKDVLLVELAALLHDVGHCAFSHSFGHYLKHINIKDERADHEICSLILAEYILKEKSDILDITRNDIEIVKYYIDPLKYIKKYKTRPENYIAGFDMIVSSENTVDIDKMDYIQRDTEVLIGSGILNNIDVVGILKRTAIVNGIWMYHCDDMSHITDCVTRRTTFYVNKYTNPLVSAVNCMMIDVLCLVGSCDSGLVLDKCVGLDTEEDIKNYIKLTDKYIIEYILNSNDQQLRDARLLLKSILTRTNIYVESGMTHNLSGVVDKTKNYTMPWNPQNDKSSPMILLPKIRYHVNGTETIHGPVTFLIYNKQNGKNYDE